MREIRRFSLPIAALLMLPLLAVISHGQQTREPPLAGSRPPEKPPVAKPPADPRAQLTETVGLLSGLYLYQTYLTIGLLADGKSERLYDENAARNVLASVLNPLDAVDRQLTTVVELAQTPADRQAAERLRGVVALLKQQGKELIAFWDSRQ